MHARASRTALGLLAGAGGLTLAAWQLLFRRTLPQTRGELHVRGLESEVRIGRDALGVPRIVARSRSDLAFGQGFCLGQDRLFQLEFFRRAAAGRTSEFAGEEGVQADRLMRTLGLHRRAQQEADEIDPWERHLLEAYSAGVDAAVAAAKALPLELQLLRIEPEPWTPADSLAIGKLIALGFSTNMEAELFRADLIARIGAEKAARLEPRYPQGSPVVTQPGVPWDGDALGVIEQLNAVKEAIGLGPAPAGSNNWVVSGERSATGKPLLAGDPHISSAIPNVWYRVELQAPEIELSGGCMPGFPGVFIGQSRHVAWTFTNVMADVQDLFVEKIREGQNGDSPRYLFKDEWLPLEVRREDIQVRGRSSPEVLEVRATHHGPIVNEALGARLDAQPLALAWTALREPFFTRMALDVGYVRQGPEVVANFHEFHVPAMNMLWADSSGNIGYKLVGKLPRRRGNCPDLPKPGWTGEYEWEGYVPYDDLPALVNPPDGVLVTANNRIAPADYPHHITSEYLDGWRAQRIEQLLGERRTHSLEDFARMQIDVFSIPGEMTAHRLARLRPPHQREVRAIERLKSWDHRLDERSVAGSIYHFFTHHFALLASEAVIGDKDYAERWRSKSQLGFTPMNSAPWRFHARLIELWDEADPQLIGGRDWNELAIEALTNALDDLTDRFGADPESWRWGRAHQIHFAHPLGDGEALPSRLIDLLLSRRRPAPGGHETVNAIGFVPYDGSFTGIYGPTYRLLADLGDADASRWQHMTGQSGHPASPHYDDLVDAWMVGRTNPVAQPSEETLTLLPG
jgi:penicillin G amidase